MAWSSRQGHGNTAGQPSRSPVRVITGKARRERKISALATESGHPAAMPRGRLGADIVAKVAAASLWNSNLKETNRDVRNFESMLRVRVKT
jgi:hypothetical protein